LDCFSSDAGESEDFVEDRLGGVLEVVDRLGFLIYFIKLIMKMHFGEEFDDEVCSRLLLLMMMLLWVEDEDGERRR
jgi:hypothetical protein